MANISSPPNDNARRLRGKEISIEVPTNNQVLAYNSGTEEYEPIDITSLIGAPFNFKGTWNASTNTPTLADGTGTTGDVYITSVAGTRNLGSGSQTFDVGDLVLYGNAVWTKVDHTDAVVSVAGHTGVVTQQQLNSAVTITANAASTFDLDLSLANNFKVAVTDSAILRFINVPSGFVTFNMQLTSTSIFTFDNVNTLPAGGSSGASSFASITSDGPVLLTFVSYDGGTNWRYSLDTYRPVDHSSRHRAGGADEVISNNALGTSTSTGATQNSIKTYVDAAKTAAQAFATSADTTVLATAEAYADAKVADTIMDAVTTIAPSQNAVFDALALKIPTSYLDTDGTLAANSDSKLATQKAVKTYVDGHSSGITSVRVDTVQFTNDFTTSSSPSQAVTGASIASLPAAAGDVIEVQFALQIVSGGAGNGVNFNYSVSGGSDRSLAKCLSIVGQPNWVSSVGYYTVQSGDISGGNISVALRVSLDNTNSVTLKGLTNLYNILSVKNLKH